MLLSSFLSLRVPEGKRKEKSSLIGLHNPSLLCHLPHIRASFPTARRREGYNNQRPVNHILPGGDASGQGTESGPQTPINSLQNNIR